MEWRQCLLAIRIWNWCRTQNIAIQATYVPRLDNRLTDVLSRETVPHEWKIHPQVSNEVFSK